MKSTTVHSLCHKYLLSSFLPEKYTHPLQDTHDQRLILQYSISISGQNITPLELYICELKWQIICPPHTQQTMLVQGHDNTTNYSHLERTRIGGTWQWWVDSHILKLLQISEKATWDRKCILNQSLGWLLQSSVQVHCSPIFSKTHWSFSSMK